MTNHPDIKLSFFSSSRDEKLLTLKNSNKVIWEIDLFEHSLDELFDIDHPMLRPTHPDYSVSKENFINQWKEKGPFEDQGTWVYYHWTKTLIHFPDELTFRKLRSSRNRNLITAKEQAIFESKCIGIAGMSVGSNILNTLVLTSGPRHIKICDFDTISIPNLNRIAAPASAVGINKAIYFAQKNLEIDPYLTIEIFPNGLNEGDFTSFFEEPKLDLFIEEMDNPYLKIQSRKYARKLGIPVIMAADNGDGALIDVERFDLEPDRPLFHGRLDKYNLDAISPDMPFPLKLAIIADMVHLEEATPRAQDSLEQVGKVLNTWPQLGTAALMAGVTISFVGRRLLLGEPMHSGRYSVELEEFLVPETRTPQYKQWRADHTKEIIHNFEAFKKQLEKMQS